jgi:hypothetical protein
MSEQYAFAIGFDRELEESGDGLDEGWANRLEEVATAVTEAGLPAIDSERWDEFGQGRVFWGTKAECESVRQVLSHFDLYTEEDRNLDPGYYATAHHTYYVDAEGEIYVLPDWSIANHNFEHSFTSSSLENICAIPLDAYRLRTIDREIDAQVQSILKGAASQPDPIESSVSDPLFAEDIALADPVLEDLVSDNPVSEDLAVQTSKLEDSLPNPVVQSPPIPMVPADVHAELQATSAQQGAQIMELEHRLRSVLIQVDQLQSAALTQVDPKVHERLKLQCNQQTQRIEALQTQVQSTAGQCAALQQQVAQQSNHVLELEQAIAQAQAKAQVNGLESEASQAIHPDDYNKVQQQTLAQTAQIQELQQFVQRLEQQLQDVTAQSEQKVDASKYDALEQDVADKSAIIKELRRNLQQQERDVREWQTVAEAKVDWSEHQALREELQRLQTRKKRGFFARLFDWIWN